MKTEIEAIRRARGILHGWFTTGGTLNPADTARLEATLSLQGSTLIPISGNNQWEPSLVVGWNNAGGIGQFTVAPPFQGAGVRIGDQYILVLRGEGPITRQDIYDILNSLEVKQETGGIITTDGNEQVVYEQNNPGVMNPLWFKINLDNMLAADTVVVKVYYRVNPLGNLELEDFQSYTGVDGGLPNGRKVDSISLTANRFGWRITIQRTAGADHAYDWEVFWGA